MIIDKVVQEAGQYLRGRKVKDLVVGVSLVAAELDDGGNAVLNAAAQQQVLPDCGGRGEPFGLRMKGGETVGMVGMIGPAVKMLQPWDCKWVIFDNARKGQEGIFPAERQEELLPTCDIVFLSGTTTINRTIDQLLGWCRDDCRIVMIGSSTPMYPAAFADTNVRILAGAFGDRTKKEQIFRLISLASGMDGLRGCMEKKNVAVHTQISTAATAPG